MRRLSAFALLGLAEVLPALGTEFGGMVNFPHPPELLRQTVQEGRLTWFRSAGRWPAGQEISEQTVVYPAASITPRGGKGSISLHSYPSDLWKVFDAARTQLRSHQPSVQDWEIGNEMEFVFSRDLPDLTAAATKAAHLGLRMGGARGRILMPSLAYRPGPYAQQLLDNHLAAHSDGWNFHFYGWAQDFAGNIREHRKLLADRGLPPMPLWATEVGTPDSSINGVATNLLPLLRQASFFERLAVEAWMEEVAGFGAFILSPFVSEGIDYGMSASDFSPRPAMNRYLHAARTLPDCRPRYWLRDRATGEEVGAVMRRKDGLWWTVMWTPRRWFEDGLPSPRDGEPPIQARSGNNFPLTLRPADGTRFGTEPEPTSVVPVGREIQFTVSAITNLHLLSRPGRFSIEGVDWIPWKPSPKAPSPRPTGPVVVQIRPPDGSQPDRDGLCHRLDRGAPIRMEVLGYNFSEQPASGTFHLSPPKGWNFARPPVFPSLIPPMESVRFPVELVPDHPLHSQLRYAIGASWKGRSTPGGDTASLVVAPAGTGDEPAVQVDWFPEWIPDPPGVAWDVDTEVDHGLRITLLRSLRGELPGLIATLPAKLVPRSSDVIRLKLRHHEGLQPNGVRLELVTPTRIVTWSARPGTLTPESRTLDFRLGDFESSFWSHADPDRTWSPADIRYVRVQFGGMPTGSTVDLESVEYRRVPE